MRILALDSTAVAASVCLMDGEKIVADCYQNTRQTHSQTLMPMVQFAMQCAGWQMRDVDLLAVSAGPGSFTGVRIGISCIKGLAFPDHKPCCGVSVLQAMAENFSHQDGRICAVMDARCRQVYNALFEIKNGKVIRLCEDRALTLDELREDLLKRGEGTYILMGDGALLCRQAPELSGLSDAGILLKMAPETLCMQRASGVARAAIKAYNEEKTVNGDKLLPVYLRLPPAQRELKKRQEGAK